MDYNYSGERRSALRILDEIRSAEWPFKESQRIVKSGPRKKVNREIQMEKEAEADHYA